MTISSTNRKAGPYSGNGVAVAFPFPFKVFGASDMYVVRADSTGAETALVLNSDYTVALNSDQDSNPGGTITLPVALATGYTLTITSKVDNLQQVDLTNQGGFYPKVLTAALDRLTILVQQLSEQVSRAVKTSISSTSSPDQLISEIFDAVSSAQSYSASASGSATSAAGSAASAASSASAVGFTITDLQGQGKTGATSAGSAPNFTVTSSPAYGALSAGQRMRVKFHAGGTTGSNTLNRDGLGAKTLMQYDYRGAKVSAVVAAGMLVDVEYDGSDFVILEQLPGAAYIGKNRIINGGFDVWQLGTSFAISSHLQKVADRWNVDWNGSVGTLNADRIDLRSNSSLSALGFNPKYGIYMNQSVAGSGNTFLDLSTQIESVLTLAGKKITISFYALSASGTKSIYVKTEQYFGGGGSPSSPRFNTSAAINIGTTWQRYSVTFDMSAVTQADTIGSNGDDTLNVILSLPVNQTFGLYFTGVQIEEGHIASPFEQTSYAHTYAQCQRYLQTSYEDGVAPGTVTTQGALAFQAGGANPIATIQTKAVMRVLPAITYYNPATGAAGTWNDGGTSRAVSTNTNGTKNVSVAVSGGVAGNFVTGHYVLQDPYY